MIPKNAAFPPLSSSELRRVYKPRPWPQLYTAGTFCPRKRYTWNTLCVLQSLGHSSLTNTVKKYTTCHKGWSSTPHKKSIGIVPYVLAGFLAFSFAFSYVLLIRKGDTCRQGHYSFKDTPLNPTSFARLPMTCACAVRLPHLINTFSGGSK